MHNHKGLSIKDVRRQKALSSAEKERGFYNADVRTFWCKLRIFRNLWFPHGQEGKVLSQCGQFADKRGQFITILCRRLLWMAPNYDQLNQRHAVWNRLSIKSYISLRKAETTGMYIEIYCISVLRPHSLQQNFCCLYTTERLGKINCLLIQVGTNFKILQLMHFRLNIW